MLIQWLANIFIASLLLVGGMSYAATTSTTNAANAPENKGMYIVKSNDTLYSIAWQFGLDYRVIASMNNLNPPYSLTAGQQLLLVEPQHTAPPGLGNPPIIVKHLPGYSGQTTSTPTNKVTVNKSPVASAAVSAWMWPTSGTIVQGYSNSPQSVNKGIDITGKFGQAIVAAAKGEVVYSGNGIPGYGNLIILKHNTDYLTAYAHNEKNLVKEGQIVKEGQEIALMGKGNSAKPELHFEIRYEGKPVNPLNYLPKR